MSRISSNNNKSYKQSESCEKKVTRRIDSDEKVSADDSVSISVIEERAQSVGCLEKPTKSDSRQFKRIRSNVHGANQESKSIYAVSSDSSLTSQHLLKESSAIKTDGVQDPCIGMVRLVDSNHVILEDHPKGVTQSAGSQNVEPSICNKEDSCSRAITQKLVQLSGKETAKARNKQSKDKLNVVANSRELNAQSVSLKCSDVKQGTIAKDNASTKETAVRDLTSQTLLTDSVEQLFVVKEEDSVTELRDTDNMLNKIKVYQTPMQDHSWNIHLNQKLELTEGMSRVLLVRLERIDNLIKMYKNKMNVKHETELPANRAARKASVDLTDLNTTSKPRASKTRSQSMTQENTMSFNLDQQDISSLPVSKKTVEESSNISSEQSSKRCNRGNWSADCIVCKERFIDRLELHKHATLSHSDKQILFCEFCGKTFLRERILKRHREATHSEEMDIKKSNTAKKLLTDQKEEITTSQDVREGEFALAVDFQESVNDDTQQLPTSTKQNIKTRPRVQVGAIKSDKQVNKDMPQKNKMNNRQLPYVSTMCKNQLFNSGEVERKKYLSRLRSRFHQTFSDVQKLKERNKIKDAMSCSMLLTSTVKTEEEDEIKEDSVSSSKLLTNTEKITENNTVTEMLPSHSTSRIGIRKMKYKSIKKLVVPLIRLEDIPTTQSLKGKAGKLLYLARKKKSAVRKRNTAQCNKMRNKKRTLNLVRKVTNSVRDTNASKCKINKEFCEVKTETQEQNDATGDTNDGEIMKSESTTEPLVSTIQCDRELEQILSSNIHTSYIESLKNNNETSNIAIAKSNWLTACNQDASTMKEGTIASDDCVEKAIENLFKNGSQTEIDGQEGTVQDTVKFEHSSQKLDEDKRLKKCTTVTNETNGGSKKVTEVDKPVVTSVEIRRMPKTKVSAGGAKKNVCTTNLTTENPNPKSNVVNAEKTSVKSKEDVKIITQTSNKKDNSETCKENVASKISKQNETNTDLQSNTKNERAKRQRKLSNVVEVKDVPRVIVKNIKQDTKKLTLDSVPKIDSKSTEKDKECEKNQDKTTPAKVTRTKAVIKEPDIEQELKIKTVSKSYPPRKKHPEDAVTIPNQETVQVKTNININGLCAMCKNVFESMIELRNSYNDQKTPIKCPFCDSYFVSFYFLECHVGHMHTTCSCKTLMKVTKTPQKNVSCKVNEELAFACRYCPKRFDSVTEFNSHAINAHSTSANSKRTINVDKLENIIVKQSTPVQSKRDEVKSKETADKIDRQRTIDSLQETNKNIEECITDGANQNKESCQGKASEQSKTVNTETTFSAQSMKKYAEDYTIACKPCFKIFSTQQEYVNHLIYKHKKTVLSVQDVISDERAKQLKKRKNLPISDRQQTDFQKKRLDKDLCKTSSPDKISVTSKLTEADDARPALNEIHKSNNDVKCTKASTISKEASSHLHGKGLTDNEKVTSKGVTKLSLSSIKYESKSEEPSAPPTSPLNVTKATNTKTYKNTRPKIVDMQSKVFFINNEKDVAVMQYMERLKSNRNKKSGTESVHTIYPCSGCKEVFLDMDALDQHRATVHRSYFRFVCDICFMSFKKEEDVKVHKARHQFPKVISNRESSQSVQKETTSLKRSMSEVEFGQKKVKTISNIKDDVQREKSVEEKYDPCKSSFNENWESNNSNIEETDNKQDSNILSSWKTIDLFGNTSSESIKDDCTLNSNIMQCHGFHKDDVSTINNTSNQRTTKSKPVNLIRSIQYFPSNANNLISCIKGNAPKCMIQNADSEKLRENRSSELESILTNDQSVTENDLRKNLDQDKNMYSTLRPVKLKITNNIKQMVIKVKSKSKTTSESETDNKNQSSLLGKRKVINIDPVSGHKTPVKIMKIDNVDNSEKVKTEIKVECNICDKQFDLQEELNKHMHVIHNRSIKCMTQTSLLKSQLQKECDRPKKIDDPITMSDSVMCEYCALEFDSISLLEVHKTTIHKLQKQRFWDCTMCDQSFNLLQKYLLHRYHAHHDQSVVHACENCNKVLTSVAMVNVHLCENVTSWSCQPCKMSFTNSMALRVHNTEAHLETVGPHMCDMCAMEFLTVSMLNRHKNVEHLSVVSSSCERVFPAQNFSNECRGTYKKKLLESQMQKDKKDTSKSDGLEGFMESVMDSVDGNNDLNNQSQSQGKSQKFSCGLCRQICQSKVGLKIHLTRRHQTTAEVCHICYKVCVCEKMLHHIIKEHIVYDKSSEIDFATADQSDIAEKCEDRIDELLGMKRLLSLCEYEVFNEEPRGKCLTCPLCPQLFATPRFFKVHHLWSHDTLCVMCDIEFKSSREAAEHKFELHGSVGSYMWLTEKLVSAVVKTKKYGENIRNVIFEIVTKEIGKCSDIVNAEMSDTEKRQEESEEQTNCSYNSELPDSTNLSDFGIKTDFELQNLLEDYKDFSLTQQQDDILDILTENDKNDDLSVTDDETIERLKELVQGEIKEVQTAAFLPKESEELANDIDDENFVLVVTEEDLIQYKNNIKGLASRITSTCSLFSLEDIEKLLENYMQNIQNT